MGYQYFYADSDQYDTTQQFGFELAGYGLAEPDTELVAGETEQERYQTNDDERENELRDEAIARAGKGDANGQGVDAGGYSQ